jgi:hypothetical protein
VTVAGSDLEVAADFALIPVPYPVTWTETGLPTGTTWSVVVRNTTLTGDTAQIATTEVDGTYGYQVASVDGFAPDPASNYVLVAGGPASVTVAFTPIPYYYTVEWLETGLPAGTAWSVTVRNDTATSTGPSADLREVNGTYSYAITPIPGYRAAPPNGGFVISGGSVTIDIVWAVVPFEPHYTVVFTAGSAPGGSWSVSFAGLNASSTGASVTFSVPNGTFHYAITAPSGHYATPGGGTVIVAGAPVTLAFTFGPPDPPSPLLDVAHAAAVAAVVVCLGVLTFVLLSRRRARREPAIAEGRAGTPFPDYCEEVASLLSSRPTPEWIEDAAPR